MSRRIFFYREKKDYRDACVYIENPTTKLECGHYFGGLRPGGAAWSGRTLNAPYEEVETVLSKSDYETLLELDRQLDKVGYGLDKDEKRRQKGAKIVERMQEIVDKLKSENAKEFFETIVKSEKEKTMREYNLSEEDVDQIYDEYPLSYQDHGIVSYVWTDIDEYAEEEALELGYVDPKNPNSDRYFDYETFGQDLLEGEDVLELGNGRIVTYYM